MPIPIKYLKEWTTTASGTRKEAKTHAGSPTNGTTRRGIFFVGPRGGKYYTSAQLKIIFNKEIQKVLQIGENLVSIFLLAPITAQTAGYLHSRWSAKSFNRSSGWARMVDSMQVRKVISLVPIVADDGDGGGGGDGGGAPPLQDFVCGDEGPARYRQKETRLLGNMALEFVAARLLVALWKYFRFVPTTNGGNDDFQMRVVVGKLGDEEKVSLRLDGWSFENETVQQEMRRCLVVCEALLLALVRDQLAEEMVGGQLVFSPDRVLAASCVVDGRTGVVKVVESVVRMGR